MAGGQWSVKNAAGIHADTAQRPAGSGDRDGDRAVEIELAARARRVRSFHLGGEQSDVAEHYFLNLFQPPLPGLERQLTQLEPALASLQSLEASVVFPS